jgi:hypothetical protein
VTIKPANRIRRFNVFAEYRKQQEQDHGMPADQAKGYGLWVAKVVAARKFGHLNDREPPSQAEARARRRRKWRVSVACVIESGAAGNQLRTEVQFGISAGSGCRVVQTRARTAQTLSPLAPRRSGTD